MTFANRRNKFNNNLFNIDTTNFGFNRLSDFEIGVVYPVCGVAVFTTKFGESPCIITDSAFVNLPKFMTDEILEIMNDETDVKDINDGKVGFKVRTYEETRHGRGKCYAVEWVDR